MTTFESLPGAPHDPSLLHDHIQRCAAASGRLHRLQTVAESINGFLAPRFVTTLALSLVVLAATMLAV